MLIMNDADRAMMDRLDAMSLAEIKADPELQDQLRSLRQSVSERLQETVRQMEEITRQMDIYRDFLARSPIDRQIDAR